MKSYIREALLTSVDIFINFTIIGPLVAFFWKGTWDTIDFYFIPEQKELSLWVSFIGGSIALLLFTLLQGPINRTLLPDHYPLLFHVTSRFHAYLIGITQVMLWRGSWGLFDLYLTIKWLNLVVSGCLGTLFLSVLGGLSLTSGVPFSTRHDFDQEDYFTVTPIDREIQGRRLAQWIEHSPFTKTCKKDVQDWIWLLVYGSYEIVVYNLLVVVTWRSLWELMDILIIPDNLTLSAYISLFISVTLATPVILGENMLRTYCRKLEVSQALGVFKKLLSKGYIMLTVCITVNLWRGAWHLQTTLLLPGNPKLSALISHCVGFAGLMLCLVTRTLAGGADFEDSDIYEQCVTMYSMSCVKRFVEKFDSKVSAVPQDTDLQDFAGIGL